MPKLQDPIQSSEPSPCNDPDSRNPNNPPKILVEDVRISFRHSFDRCYSVREKLGEIYRRFRKGHKPSYSHVLKEINLRVESGDVVGVIGPNGSGKSTLLRTIAGIYEPDEGRVELNGRVSTLLSLGTGFNNKMSGRDNIVLNALTLGMSRAGIESKLEEVIEYADIGEHIDVPMKYYSSGMISRVSFAIVLVMRPDILLIDEVFSVGDLQFKQKSERTLRDMLKQASCQIIVSHSLSFIKGHCNRVILVESGRIRADGDPEEVIALYQSLYSNKS